jgi:hypothetical protein
MGEAIGARDDRAAGILLGRTTYEMFEPAWSTRTVEDDPGAPFFNDTTKYVVSGTLENATWRNSRSSAVRPRRDPELKDESTATSTSAAAGRSCARCSRTASSTRCTCSSSRSPRGSGRGSSPGRRGPGAFSLAASEAYDNGVVYLAYRPQTQ